MRGTSLAITVAAALVLFFSAGSVAANPKFVYTKDALREIAFPLGGIGAGNISIEGRGAFRDWEIYNRPNKGSILPGTFPIIWCKAQGQQPQCRVIQGIRDKNFVGDAPGLHLYRLGEMRHQGDGMPCFSSVEFEASFELFDLLHPTCITMSTHKKRLNNFLFPISITPYQCYIYIVKGNSQKKLKLANTK
jgi:hypothetical protein